MVIKTLKPSQRVQGRWLAQLEDGSLLRLGGKRGAELLPVCRAELTDGGGRGPDALSGSETPAGSGP